MLELKYVNSPIKIGVMITPGVEGEINYNTVDFENGGMKLKRVKS